MKKKATLSPSYTPEILIMLILMFTNLASAFGFDVLSGEGEISIPCWSLCFAIVWLSVREQSDSPVCHLFLLGGLPEVKKCGDQGHIEQDATVLSFFHSLELFLNSSKYHFLLPTLLTWSDVRG